MRGSHPSFGHPTQLGYSGVVQGSLLKKGWLPCHHPIAKTTITCCKPATPPKPMKPKTAQCNQARLFPSKVAEVIRELSKDARITTAIYLENKTEGGTPCGK